MLVYKIIVMKPLEGYCCSAFFHTNLTKINKYFLHSFPPPYPAITYTTMAASPFLKNGGLELMLSNPKENPSAEEWLEMKVKNVPCAACAKRGIDCWTSMKGNQSCEYCLRVCKRTFGFYGNRPEGYGFGHFLFMLWNNWKHCERELQDVKEQLQETKAQLTASISNRNEIMENYDAMEAGLVEAGLTKKQIAEWVVKSKAPVVEAR